MLGQKHLPWESYSVAGPVVKISAYKTKLKPNPYPVMSIKPLSQSPSVDKSTSYKPDIRK